MIELRDAIANDLPALVQMNLELIQDEAYDQPRTVAELHKRMARRIAKESSVCLFHIGGVSRSPIGS